MRSADSWIGVSGFLISCARRRATSAQAIERCADTTSVMSSNTIRRASFGSAAPRTSRLMRGLLVDLQLEGVLPVVAFAGLGAGAVQLVALPHRRARTRPGPAPRPAAGRGTPTAAGAGCAWRPGSRCRCARWRSNTMTPAVSVVQDGLQPRARAFELRHAALRPARARRPAARSCARSARVRPPSSSRDANTGLAVRSPLGHLAHAVGQHQQRPRDLVAEHRPPAARRRTPPAPAPASACRCTCGAGPRGRARAAGIRGTRPAPPAHWPPAAATPAAPPTGSAPRAPRC